MLPRNIDPICHCLDVDYCILDVETENCQRYLCVCLFYS